MVNKGFVHIIEVVLISVILVISISFILRPLEFREDWGAVELRRLGESAVDSLHRKYGLEEIVFNDSRSFEDKADELFYNTGNYETVGYEARIEESYRSNLTIAMNCGTGSFPERCNEAEEKLEKLLGNTWMNRRSFDFWTEINAKDDWGSIEGGEYDLIFVWVDPGGGDGTFPPGQIPSEEDVQEHLEAGGGIVLYSDRTGNEDFQEEIFGIEDNGNGGDQVVFNNREDPSLPNYEPSKLFYGVGSMANDIWSVRGEEYEIEVEDPGKEITVKKNGNDLCTDCEEGDWLELGDEGLDDDNFTIRRIEEISDGDHPYGNENVVWFDYPEGYEFKADVFSSSAESTVDEDYEVLGEEEPRVVINKPYNGRAVWVSTDGDADTVDDTDDDIRSLVQAGVVWAAPRGENIAEAPRPSIRAASEITRFGFIDDDIYEPYIFNMNIWYTY